MRRADTSIQYFCPRPGAFETLVDELEAAGACSVCSSDRARIELGGAGFELIPFREVEPLAAHLDMAYVNLLVVDLRPADGWELEAQARAVRDLLTRLDQVKDIEARFGFHRIMAVVGDDGDERVDALLLELGARGVRQVLRARHGEPFGPRLLEAAGELVGARRVGRTALCLSGGGTTGIYFELGALKCLADCLPPGSLQRFDMIFGISAGAVVGSTLAAGFAVDEFMAALAGVGSSRIPPLDFRVGRPSDLNWRDGVERVVRSLAARVLSVTPARASRLLGGLLGPAWPQTLGDLMGPFFSLDRLERTLAEMFASVGVDDRFDRTVTELYIGASDQDLREHVLFGEGDYRDVPISRAVRASASFTPAFGAVEIGGRYYDDGAVTRTSNFGAAIERGATLVVVVDPFLPHVSNQSGSAHRRGIFYQVDQVIRTMSFTRFEQARAHTIRANPELSIYTFLPSNRLRHLLAENPLEDRHYLEIWRAAYLSTHARLRRLGHRMTGDFAAHGLELDLRRANIVAEQLGPRPNPSLEDFYPRRRIELTPPRADHSRASDFVPRLA